MLFGFEPVLGNGENGGALFWVIVTVFVVISQAMKARKQKSGSARKPGAAAPSGADPVNPSDELQRFLQGLSGGAPSSQAEPAKSAAPPPVPRQARTTTTRAGTAFPAAGRASYAMARPTAETARKRPATKRATFPAPPPPPPPAATKDVWTKTKKPEFQHVRHGESFADKPDARQQRLRALRGGIGDALIGKDHLRQAVALKEILGPPLGLRASARLNAG